MKKEKVRELNSKETKEKQFFLGLFYSSIGIVIGIYNHNIECIDLSNFSLHGSLDHSTDCFKVYTLIAGGLRYNVTGNCARIAACFLLHIN